MFLSIRTKCFKEYQVCNCEKCKTEGTKINIKDALTALSSDINTK